MKRNYSIVKTLCIVLALFISPLCKAQTGTWQALTNLEPQQGAGLMLLMTDGTVMCQSVAGNYTGWDKLTPDSHGSYINGTWTSVAAMNQPRLFFASQVLPDGRLFVSGGEYYQGDTAGEVYDPVANTWTRTSGVTLQENIYDGNSEMLPDGQVLVGAQAGPSSSSMDCLFFTPSTNQWALAPNSPLDHDEAQWLKLPDSSILFIGMATQQSCRYIPKTNTWINDANVPVSISDTFGFECGPGVMLPNGKAVFFGGYVYNAIYTPSGNVNPGTWAAAANYPIINGVQVGITDGPGAMMVNGHIILGVSPVGTSYANEFRNPAYFLEYNYLTNSFAQVTSVIPYVGADSIAGNTGSNTTFLDLPDGTVLMMTSQNNDTVLNQKYFIYTPGSGPIAAGKPTINSILPDACPLYKITGKLFNGISEGTEYGDDLQQSSNYPLVRLTNSSGNVYYCKTTNWNRIGAVQTDSLEDTAVFETPAALPAGTYSLVVVVNGFASNPTLFTTLQSTTYSVNDNGSCNGIAAVTPIGGIAPYTYLWTTAGQTTDTIKSQCAGTYCCKITDNNGCTYSTCVTVNLSTGTNTIGDASRINLFPEPNAGYFTLTGLNGGEIIEIYNELGQEMQRKAADNNSTLNFNISSYPNGVYLIRIQNRDGSLLTEKKITKIE
jgi:hypothetical protein